MVIGKRYNNQELSDLKSWEREFRRDANVDELVIFRDHLRLLDLPDKPELMLEGTIQVVQACCAYAKLDGQPLTDFLAMQRYNPAWSGNARYAFTFDLCGKASARVLVTSKMEVLDLADLYGQPWPDFKACGYYSFWITRANGTALSNEERAQLEEEVIYDLRFDYSEDELVIWFDEDSIYGAMSVSVHDCDGLDEDGDPIFKGLTK